MKLSMKMSMHVTLAFVKPIKIIFFVLIYVAIYLCMYINLFYYRNLPQRIVLRYQEYNFNLCNFFRSLASSRSTTTISTFLVIIAFNHRS